MLLLTGVGSVSSANFSSAAYPSLLLNFQEKKARSVCFFPSFVKAIIKSLLQVSIGIQIQGWTMGLSQEVTRLASSWIQSSGVADHPNSSCLTSMMTYLYRVATEDLNHDGCSIVQRAGMISVARGRA